ncbi:sensor domain-containing protein [Rhodovulum steppense]|uniref:PAS domain S-box-containing protein/diguanylate cyclase (GGDEF)-like protein n=1 Tax=Rhodovulum steppense TaxID=540251 RepID=A0A4V2R4U8_9RHOB|nr:EAL domain-containing protein [Rhodovulum steppense]TCM85504.1 PAS domain S-box-containing protein/diguanylate cyclase (GGDEF)-like protein [Rhodovulum steppense]
MDELLALHAAGVGSWIWDLQHCDLWLDPGFRALLGRDSSVGKEFFLPEICKAEDLTLSDIAISRIQTGRAETLDIDLRLKTASGATRHIRMVGGIAARNEECVPIRLTGIALPIRSEPEGRAFSRRAEALLRHAGMLAGLGCWELVPETGEMYWSDETCRIHGVPPDYRPTLEDGIKFYAPDVRDTIAQAVSAGLQTGTPWDLELPLDRADGARIYVRAIGEPVREAGRTVRILGAFQDITERKETERRLEETAAEARAARDRLNTLADSAPGALFEHHENLDGTVTLPYFSAKLPDLLGVAGRDIHEDGAAAARNIVPEDMGTLAKAMDRSRRDGSPLQVTYRLQHPEKGVRWMALYSIPSRNEDCSVTWSGNVFDVTEATEVGLKAQHASEELCVTLERLRTVVENVPGAIFEHRGSAGGKLEYAFFSGKFGDILGVDDDEIRRDGWAVLRNIAPADRSRVRRAIEEAERSASPRRFRYRVHHPKYGRRWIDSWANPVRKADGSISWFGKITDITDQIEAEEIARRSAEETRRTHDHLRVIANVAPVGLFEVSRDDSGGVRFPYLSERFLEMTGIEAGELARDPDCIPGRLRREDRAALAASIDGRAGSEGAWRHRVRYDRPGTGHVWFEVAAVARAEAKRKVVWVGVCMDVSDTVRREVEMTAARETAEMMEAENRRLAFLDPLTGLPNRRGHDEHLAAAIRALGTSETLTVIEIDIDRFKPLNDAFGHRGGDLVLQAIAGILNSSVRESDFAARIGGDEFSLILAPGTSAEDALRIAERIQSRLATPIMFEGRQINVSASLGIASIEATDLDREDVLRYADAALYRAKSEGRNRIEVFSGATMHTLRESHRLELEFEEALRLESFEPWFQPQLSADRRRVVGLEVLARWDHPVRGTLTPDVFLPLAEKRGVVSEIDRIMMRKTAPILGTWKRAGVDIPKVGFNVCSARMHDPEVVSCAREIVASGTSVAFELLESILVEEESDVFSRHLQLLRDAGVSIEIDDFGSSHTSIVGLLTIAPSVLKIDRRIVAPIVEDPRSRDVVRTIVDLARSLGMETIAEGVETIHHARILQEVGCNGLQGFLFSRPLPACAVPDLLEKVISGS